MIKKTVSRIAACLMIILLGVLLLGCPATPSSDYNYVFESTLQNEYGIDFDKTNRRTVKITYRIPDGTEKTAIFQLDGYNAKKKVGYKLVTLKDKTQWEKDRANGNLNAPDLSDIKLIQEAAARNASHIFFISIYSYQNDTGYDQIIDDQGKVNGDARTILQTPEIKQWIEDGLYSGEWVKDGIEQYWAKDYQFGKINFKHDDLRNVIIGYGDNQKAVFRLDGYDPEKQIGYKFVTAADEKRWEEQRKSGDINAPYLSESEQIRTAALWYDFPIIFIYAKDYWKSNIIGIISSSQVMVYKDRAYETDTRRRLREWYDEHGFKMFRE